MGTLLKSLALLLVQIAVALLGGCAATELPHATTDLDTRSTVADWSAFTLGPNDLVTVDVFGAPQYGSSPRGVRIAPDGTLALPLLGALPVGGRTASEVASAVEAGLSEYLAEPRVSVAVVEYSSRRFYLFGEIKQPGPIPMDRPITALEALAMGGGWQPGANREHVVIVRTHGEDVEVIEFDGATPGPDGLVQVRPDDFLFVGKAGVGVFSESMMPYLQGLGMTASQLASLVLVTDKLND